MFCVCYEHLQVQESDLNHEILQTGYISPYMDFILHAACVTGEFDPNMNLTPTTNLCIGDMTFMDTSAGIKNRPSRYGFNILIPQVACMYS